MKFYIISPPTENNQFTAEKLEKISEIIPVEFFQFRPKHKKIEDRLKFVRKNFNQFKKVCKRKKIKMIINDDFDIAEKFNFDGIHLGQRDRKCRDAKKIFGKNFIVGVSCSDSLSLYNDALKQKADYVAFGPIFETFYKKKKKIDIYKFSKKIRSLRLPFTLIGGINHNNFKKCLGFNPDYIAMISSFWNFKDGPVKSALLFQRILRGMIAYEN
jgi:thiamine-phosphate pyrophosphorylase